MRVRNLILAAGAIAAVACGGGDDAQGPGDGPPGDDADILVRNNNFSPATFEVASGGTVLWRWASSGVVHNVTFGDVAPSPNQGTGTFQRTFAAAGSYPYLCTIHGQIMSGVVTVTAAAPAPGGGDDGGGDDGGGDDNPYDPGGPGY